MDLASAIEAVLFAKGEAISMAELGRILNISSDELRAGLSELREGLTGGIRLAELHDSVQLVTAPEFAEIIQLFTENESKELSRPAEETLALILYSGPISKQQIDYVRGVNSVYILRNLMIRGLIEKNITSDKKVSLYQPSLELLSRLGITRVQELPDYESLKMPLTDFIANADE